MPLTAADVRSVLDSITLSIHTVDPSIRVIEGAGKAAGRGFSARVRIAGTALDANHPDYLVELLTPANTDQAQLGYVVHRITEELRNVPGIIAPTGAVAFERDSDPGAEQFVFSWLIRWPRRSTSE